MYSYSSLQQLNYCSSDSRVTCLQAWWTRPFTQLIGPTQCACAHNVSIRLVKWATELAADRQAAPNGKPRLSLAYSLVFLVRHFLQDRIRILLEYYTT